MFELSEMEEMVQKTAREAAELYLRPTAAARDESGDFPRKENKKLAELGFMGILVDKKYEGQGFNTFCLTLILEEICRVCASTGVGLSVHNSLVCGGISAYGTEEQKEKYLPRLSSGEWLGAYALTEPNAGSDAAGIRTGATQSGNEYILDGSKMFITSGAEADVTIVFAVTDRLKRSHGISAFIVEKGFAGFSTGKKEHKMGLRSSGTCEQVFRDCRVPKANLLGAEGQGFSIALNLLDSGRIGIGAQSIGIGQACLDEAVKYAKQREQFGKKLAEFQATQFKLADMKAQLEASRLMVYKAARMKDAGEPITLQASMAKLLSTETAGRIADEALQIHGGYGYMKEYDIERYYRDARAVRIYEGTSEIQRIVIAKNLLKQ